MKAEKMPDMSLEEMNEYLKSVPFVDAAGMKAIKIDVPAGKLTLGMAMQPEFERIKGSGQFHGGPIASLIDTAGCFALVMSLRRGVPTVNFRTDYLLPAINTSLRAEACVRRVGRSVGVVDVDVFNDESQLVAVGRGTFGSGAS